MWCRNYLLWNGCTWIEIDVHTRWCVRNFVTVIVNIFLFTVRAMGTHDSLTRNCFRWLQFFYGVIEYPVCQLNFLILIIFGLNYVCEIVNCSSAKTFFLNACCTWSNLSFDCSFFSWFLVKYSLLCRLMNTIKCV